jgi:hypothetical protein
MKFKLLYYAPFILTVIISLCYGIPETLSFVAGWLFISIFYVGLPILVFCLPYFLYSFQAVFRTIVLLVIFLIVSANIYQTMESVVYFTNKTKTELTKQSLTLFEERMKTKGKVERIHQISRMNGWADVEVSGLVEGRGLEIDVMPINKDDNRSVDYYYRYKDGKWSLDSTIAQIN